MGAVVWGARSRCYRQLSLVPAPQFSPWLRFPFPLIKPDLRFSRIRLSDWLHVLAPAGRPSCFQRSRKTRRSP